MIFQYFKVSESFSLSTMGG